MKKIFFLFFLLAFTVATFPAAQAAQKSDTSAKQKQTSRKTAKKRTVRQRNTASQSKTRQKQAAEAEQKKLHHQLNTLKKEITRTEKARGKAAEELAQSEKAISSTERSLSELGKQKSLAESRLSRLASEHAQLQTVIARQQRQLADIMQQQYLSGGENRMKLLFSGDNPNRISRELQYMNYFSIAHTRLIESLRSNLDTLHAKQLETNRTRQELDKIVTQTNRQKSILEKEKSQHAVLLARLSEKLASQKEEAKRLEQDEKRLAGLVSRLNRAIEAQRKAAEKRQAKQRQATRKSAGKSRVAREETETARDVPYRPDTTSAFGRLRGRLKMPVSGTITARYGMKRADGPSWKGIFIKTSAGAPVHAVANGRVVFADFLRGFGNLIIIDHGNQYMTIYGNAQSFSRRVGDNVSAGDTIASAGNSGENTETGLYFEVRHDGRAYNPLDWIR